MTSEIRSTRFESESESEIQTTTASGRASARRAVGERSRNSSVVQPAARGALAILTLALSGCRDGALGGGGRIEPSVRVLVDDQAAADAGEEEIVEVAGYGTFTGRVFLEGALPAVPPNLPSGTLKDPAICIRDQIPNDRLVVNSANNGVQHVFVFLARKPPGTPADLAEPPAVPVMFDQKVCTFRPHALVLRAGQEMRILNSDATVHNTNINAPLNGIFNSTVGANDSEGVPYTYARAERSPVRVVCDFHPWMLAWHLPLDHPYGAATDETGAFTIENIPAGTYQFAVYHEGRKLMDTAPVTITPDQTTTLEVPVAGAALLGRVDPGQLRTVVISSLP